LPPEEPRLPSEEPSLPAEEPSLPVEEPTLPLEEPLLPAEERRSPPEERLILSGAPTQSSAALIRLVRGRRANSARAYKQFRFSDNPRASPSALAASTRGRYAYAYESSP